MASYPSVPRPPAYYTALESAYNSPVIPSTNVNDSFSNQLNQMPVYYSYDSTPVSLNTDSAATSVMNSWPDNSPPIMTMNTPVSDIVDAGNSAPIIPSIDPVSTIWNIAAIGLKLWGGDQQAEAQRKQAAAQQKYYNDLATFETKQAAQSSFQFSLKDLQIDRSTLETNAAQSVLAAGAGYAGSSLDQVMNQSRLTASIDKAIIKQAASQAVEAGLQKAAQYRQAGGQSYDAGQKQADTTMLSTISNIGFNLFGKGK